MRIQANYYVGLILLFANKPLVYCAIESNSIAKAIEPVNIIVLGDWGGSPSFPYTTQVQTDIAFQMQAYGLARNVSFVVSTGDNFYPYGLNSTSDKRFAYTYEQVYLKGRLSSVPWFVCLGNHDHRHENGINQLNKGNRMWNMPNYFHELKVLIESKSNKSSVSYRTAKFIFIDTTLLCNLHDKRKGKRDAVDPDHYEWLVNRLSESRLDDYVFVVGHHPIVSQMSGRRQSQCLNTSINPLLMQYKVNAYLSGHDHTLQHSRLYDKTQNHLLNYFVSGAGANTYEKQKKSTKDPLSDSLFYWTDSVANGGFLTFSISIDQIDYQFRLKNGTIIYSGRIRYLKRYAV